MSKRVFITIITCLIVAIMPVAARKFTLVIDPGHGGKDAGAIGAISKEKDINLNTALAFGRYVEKNCSDVNVIYTRKTDVFVELKTRADIANKAKADLFISIHTNALPGGKVSRGLETYTLGMHRAGDNLDIAKRENSVILIENDYRERYQGFDPKSSESYIIFELMQDNNMQKSVELAKLVQKNVCSSASRLDKGVKQAGFLVLRETTMPSCLIELGFISTPDEERALNDAATVDKMGYGIYQAFLAYKRGNDGSASAKVPATKETKTPTAKETKTPTVKETKIPTVKETKASGTKDVKDTKTTTTKNTTVSTTRSKNTTTTVKTETTVERTTTVTEKDTVIVNDKTSQARQPQSKPQKHAPKAVPDSVPNNINKVENGAKGVNKAENSVKPVGSVTDSSAAPIFKIQILATDKAVKSNDPRFKGETEIASYNEGNMVKYTIGESADYNEMFRLRKTLLEKFPDCFIIAFKAGEKMNINEAIREFKNRKQ